MEEYTRKVKRGLSVSQGNESIISEARENMLGNIEERNQGPHFKEAQDTTFMLPDLSNYPCKFRAYLEKDLIDQSTLLHLENENRLNWWCDNECMQKLWPMSTTGDGNCLLHAASLAMCGFHDRHLILRHALHHRLISDNIAFYQRWAYQSVLSQKSQGFQMDVDEMLQEWHQICNLSLPCPKGEGNNVSNVPITNENKVKYLQCCSKDDSDNIKENQVSKPSNIQPQTQISSDSTSSMKPISKNSRNKLYDFLEQIHIFVLSNVLRRPIIVLCDNFVRDPDGEPIQPLEFGGLYLPLLEDASNCEKTPLLLAYYNSHFSALVPMNYTNLTNNDCTKQKTLPLAIPLIDAESDKTFSIHFNIDPGSEWVEHMELDKLDQTKIPDEKSLLMSYLSCEEYKYCPDHKRTVLRSASEASSSESGSDYQKHSLTRKLGRQIKDAFSHKQKSKSHGNIVEKAMDSKQHKDSGIKSKHPNNQQQNQFKRVRRNSQFWEKVKDGSMILGAKLNIKLPSNYESIIKNYLKNAENDFKSIEQKSSDKINVDDKYGSIKHTKSQKTSESENKDTVTVYNNSTKL